MRALSGLGIFAQTKNEYFALLPLGENLRADIPGSLKAIIITLGEIHYQACGALLHAVQEGSPAFDKVFGAGLFEYLDQNTDAANSFNEGMASLAGMLAYAVVLAYDLGRASSIVDVGGGNGRFLETILEIYPEIQGTVFDCASTIGRNHRPAGPKSRRFYRSHTRPSAAKSWWKKLSSAHFGRLTAASICTWCDCAES